MNLISHTSCFTKVETAVELLYRASKHFRKNTVIAILFRLISEQSTTTKCKKKKFPIRRMKRGQKVRALCLHKGKVVVSFDNSCFYFRLA